MLKTAVSRDNENPFAWYQLGIIYDQEGDQGRAALATAERSNLENNPKLAYSSANLAMKAIPPGSPDWLRAQDIAMSNYHLFLTPTGTVYGGGGHHFTTRDFMKSTQLFMNGGKWDGRQIVSAEWVKKSSAPLRVLNPKSGQTYGYLWNSVTYNVGGRKLYAYFPGGNGGQVAIGIPDLDLVVAFTGGNYADQVLFRSQREFVPQDILPAVK